jgi:hypothetical protein
MARKLKRPFALDPDHEKKRAELFDAIAKMFPRQMPRQRPKKKAKEPQPD